MRNWSALRLGLVCALLGACGSSGNSVDNPDMSVTDTQDMSSDSSSDAPASTETRSTSELFPVDFNNASATFEAKLRVVDQDDVAIAGATVTLAGTAHDVTSDGSITLSGINVQVPPSAVVAAPGFMPMHVSLSYANAGQAEQRVVLTESVSSTFQPNVGGTTGTGATSVSFAPGAVLSADGLPYYGEVVVAVAAVDPVSDFFKNITDSSDLELSDSFDADRVPQGALYANFGDGMVVSAPPEAVMQVELTTTDGDPLMLNSSVGATVSLQLPQITLKQIGDVVPLMSLDAVQGLWVPNGQCTVQPSPTDEGALVCVGSVRHFSTVSVAAKPAFDPGCVDYRVSVTGMPSGATITQRVEESVVAPSTTGFRPVNSTESRLYNAGMCYVSQLRWSRVVVTATSGSTVKFFSSEWQLVTPRPLTSSQLTALRNAPAENCATTCEARAVSFTYADGMAGDDADRDGYLVGSGVPASRLDCDDNNAARHPGATEPACSTADLNCDGNTPSSSGGNWMTSGLAASSWNATACRSLATCYARVAEVSGNAFDEDCDGVISDQDGDTYYAANDPLYISGVTSNPSLRADCNDLSKYAYPGGQEIAGNAIDEDCDGFAIDVDNDGYLPPARNGLNLSSVRFLRPIPESSQRFLDCNDSRADVYPGANIAPERVIENFYDWSTPSTWLTMNAALCTAFSGGSLTAQARQQLVDANCDGRFSDLDGDGYTVAGDNALGSDRAIDCNDADPRLNTQSGCMLSTAASACTGFHPSITGTSDADGDGVADLSDRCPGGDDRVDTDSDTVPDGCDPCPSNSPDDSDADGVCDNVDACPGAIDGPNPDGDSKPNGCDFCPNDSMKLESGLCGCGVAETDTDRDSLPDCLDECDTDSSKTYAGLCGCGVVEETMDSDSDSTIDCLDGCPHDALKTVPGSCGCGVVEESGCMPDFCSEDPEKTEPGICGCGVPESSTDSDFDATPDCVDACPYDSEKSLDTGICGCGISDSTPMCGEGTDYCPEDPYKMTPGICGCGVPETPGCSMSDLCPDDPYKTEPGICGCGVFDVYSDVESDGIWDCVDPCVGIYGPGMTWYRDSDGDGVGDDAHTLGPICAGSMPDGYAEIGGDCNDEDPYINPAAYEICSNGYDDNCDGYADDLDEATCGVPDTEGCTRVERDGTTYMFCALNKTFADAAIYCPSHTLLTRMASSDDASWILSQASTLGWMSGRIWIGYQWSTWAPDMYAVDGSAITYTNWQSGEPTRGTDENCVSMDLTSGTWADDVCYSESLTNPEYYFVCQQWSISSM